MKWPETRTNQILELMKTLKKNVRLILIIREYQYSSVYTIK